MKNSLVGILLVTGLFAALAFSQPSQAERTQWEYGTLFIQNDAASWNSAEVDISERPPRNFILALSQTYGAASASSGYITQILDILGGQGWELVNLDGTVAILKRPV